MKSVLVGLIIIASLYAFAHGEDKPGPHGGRVEMAKNVHTEVATDKDGSFHIFLLDGNIENPSTKNSSLEASIKSSKEELRLDCSIMGGTHFHCKSKKVRPKDGRLDLKVNREGVTVDVSYDLKMLEDNKKMGAHH